MRVCDKMIDSINGDTAQIDFLIILRKPQTISNYFPISQLFETLPQGHKNIFVLCSTMTSDGLAMQMARASAVMTLLLIYW